MSNVGLTTITALYHTRLHASSFVCTVAKETTSVTRLRSHSILDEDSIPATISQAALAATGFFNPVSIGSRTFVDSAIGANNPVDEVESEAANIWCPETGDPKPLVKCIISIGTGNPGKKRIEDDVLKFITNTLVSISTETERTATRFAGRWAEQLDQKRYFRFNVHQGLQDVALAEYKEQGRIEAATDEFLREAEQKLRMRHCVQNLVQKQSVYIEDFVKGVLFVRSRY